MSDLRDDDRDDDGPRRYSRRAVVRGSGGAALTVLGGAALLTRADSAVAADAAAAEAAAKAATVADPADGARPAPAERPPYVPRPDPNRYVFRVERTTLDPDAQKEMSGITVNGSFPGPEVRVRRGEQLRVLVQNRLDGQPTSIHWHGLLVPAGMDGVPEISNAPIAPGQMYVYEFPLRQSGTYWYHSHVGFQEQIGLFGPIVIEAEDDPVRADHDVVVMLSDWLHRSPEEVFAELRGDAAGPDAAATKSAPGASMPGMAPMSATSGAKAMTMPTPASAATAAPATAGASSPSAGAAASPGSGSVAMPAMKMAGGADLSDVKYPTFLLNGRSPLSPWTFAAKQGERVRLRIVNASGSSFFRVVLDGHRLEVTHADGIAVQPVEADHLLMGTAETYDVVVTLRVRGSFTLHAVAQDGSGQAIGVLHTPDAPPVANQQMPKLDGKALKYEELRALAPTTLPEGPVRSFRLPLQGDMKSYVWMIDGQAWPKADPLPIRPGERVQMELVNQTMMWHPMHLHGHFFRLLQGAGDRCPLKHTVSVAPGETVRIEFTADNPGRWFFHCHNVFHLEAGMAREIVYVA